MGSHSLILWQMKNSSEGSHMSEYTLNLEVIQLTGQNMGLLNRRPRGTVLSCGWKAEREKHSVSSNNDGHMQPGAISLVLTRGMAVLEPLGAHYCVRRGCSGERGFLDLLVMFS